MLPSTSPLTVTVTKPVPLTDLHARIHTGIRSRHLLARQQKLLVAVSGGQDSLCLLQLCVDLAPRWDWQLFVLHCNHRWSDDETRCAEFLADWIPQTYGIPCQIATAATIHRQEAQARHWRYQQLGHWAQVWDCEAIVMGHTGTDKAETLLLHLLRGSGSQGLSGMSWQRPLSPTPSTSPFNPTVVRPLLEVWRHETAAFCRAHQLPVWPDQSNEDPSFARNRLRQEVMPLLQQHFNPQVEQALCRTADLLTAEHDYLLAQANQLWPQVYQPDPPRLHRPQLQGQALALQRECVYRLLCEGLARQPRFDQVESVLNLVSAPQRSRTESLGSGLWAEVQGTEIILRGLTVPSPTGSLPQ